MKRFFSSRFKFNQDLVIILLLMVISVGWFWRSYVPGTFLMGWDSVMSELNLGLSFQRSISGIWQEFQGLGLQGGHGYVTDLVRLPWLWILSLVFPVSLVRYVMVYSMWLLGMVGAYGLMRTLVKRPVIGLVGSLLYGLHPFTIQNFFVIHDAFGWLFMCLPWSVWLLLSIVEKPSTRKWIGWLGLQVLASFISFIPPAFVGYGLTLGLIGLAGKHWKRGLVALVLMGVANLYWLLPFGYFTVTGSNAYVNSKLNQMTTEHNVLISQSYGSATDLILGQGFYFESLDWMGAETKPILTDWIEWWSKAQAKVAMVFLAVLAIVGLGFSRNKHKSKLTAAFGLVVVVLILPNLLRFIPLFGQAFRIPFTKISMEYVLLLGVFASLGLDFIYRKSKRLGWVGVGLGVMVVGLISWPMVNGKLFYDKMRVKVPAEYLQVISDVNEQNFDGRIAVLPIPTYNGWYIQNWNYTGSGFLFYGIKQPMLDRAFDVWSPYNETFYNELSTAFYLCPETPNEEQLSWCADNVKQVFDKYQVSLALLDESVILPGQNREVMRYELWKRILAKLDPEVDFESGFLTLFSTSEEFRRGGPPSEEENVIWSPEKYQQIEAGTTYGRFDPYFSSEVTYIEGKRTSFPFASLSKENLSDSVEYGGDGTVKINGNEISGGTVTFPEFGQGDVWRGRIRATLAGEELTVEILPFGQLVIGGQRLPLWLDQRLQVIQLGQVGKSVAVQVGGQVKTILRDQPDEVWNIPMVAGENLPIQVFDGEGQTISIATPSARLGKLPKDQLIQVSGTDKICLGYEQKNYQCLNRGHSLVTPQQGVYWLDMLEKVDELPKMTSHQLIASYEFPKEMWQQVKREFEIPTSSHVATGSAGLRGAQWEMTLVPMDIEYRMENRESEQKNCDVLGRGEAKKSVVGGGAVYEATGYGAYCDSWWVSPITEEGVLRLTGENWGGRGLKLSVFSTQENRTNLEQLLPSGGVFDQSYGFLTGLEQGLTINLETKSFGGIEGKNRLDEVEFYPVPLTWLQKIRVGEETVIENNAKIIETKKYGTGIYQVKVSGGGLVVLNQGFDKGWISPGLKHIKVNGWSNGWVLPEATETGSIVIFYWPQLLEWVGFAMLPLSLFWLRKRS